METKADIANTSNQASNIILFSSSCDGWERAGVSKGILWGVLRLYIF